MLRANQLYTNSFDAFNWTSTQNIESAKHDGMFQTLWKLINIILTVLIIGSMSVKIM